MDSLTKEFSCSAIWRYNYSDIDLPLSFDYFYITSTLYQIVSYQSSSYSLMEVKYQNVLFTVDIESYTGNCIIAKYVEIDDVTQLDAQMSSKQVLIC